MSKEFEYARDVDITPATGGLAGTVSAPPSKSATHRAYILSALAGSITDLIAPSHCSDAEHTRDCLEKLGAKFLSAGGKTTVQPMLRTVGNIVRFQPVKPVELYCGDSASTLRFILPLACALGVKTRITGGQRLFERPAIDLIAALNNMGAKVTTDTEHFIDTDALRISVPNVSIRADVSSQYISGLLMAFPAAITSECAIKLEGKRVSQGYIDLTIQILSEFGVIANKTDDGYTVSAPNGIGRRDPLRIEGDWSGAAVLLAAGALCSDDGVTVTGLKLDSAQPDRAIVDILKRMGARVDIDEAAGAVTTRRPAEGKLKPIELSVRDFPDLVPVLAPLMARADGVSRIKDAGALRDKECDRLASLSEMLHTTGATTIEGPDSLAISGMLHELGEGLIACTPYNVDVAFTNQDHRMAFAATLLGLSGRRKLMAYAGDCVDKSYPDFFRTVNSLSKGDKNVIEIRK